MSAYLLLGHIIGILIMFTTFKLCKLVKRQYSRKLENITTPWQQISSGRLYGNQ